jgi:hypothetical protein
MNIFVGFVGFLSLVCGAVLIVYTVISIKEPGFTLLLYSNLKSLKLGPTLWNSVPIFSCRSLIHYNVWKIQQQQHSLLSQASLEDTRSCEIWITLFSTEFCCFFWQILSLRFTLLRAWFFSSMISRYLGHISWSLLHFCRSFSTVRVSPVPVGFNSCVIYSFLSSC